MLSYVLVAILAAAPLSCGELVVRLSSLSNELARKLVHVLGGITAILLLLIAPQQVIGQVVLCYALVMLAVRSLLAHKIRSLYGVERSSYGEISFPIGVGAAGLLAPDQSHYIAAMLVLGFSDAAAALVGSQWPIRSWSILGGTKSLGGTAAFFLSAIALLAIPSYSFGTALAVAGAAALVEAISPRGSDNLSVPLLVAVL